MKFSRTSTSKSSASAPTPSQTRSRPSDISSPGDKPHGHEGHRTASSTYSSASLPSVSATVAKLEKGIERSKISKRTKIPKTYSDVLKHTIRASSSTPTNTPTFIYEYIYIIYTFMPTSFADICGRSGRVVTHCIFTGIFTFDIFVRSR